MTSTATRRVPSLTRPLVTAVALGALALTAACGGNSSPAGTSSPAGAGAAAPGATVKIPLLSFDPANVMVKVGQTVTWVNGNNIDHILVEGTYQTGSDGLRSSETNDGAFKLSVAKKGDTVRHTYDKAGTFPYYCTIHKGMNATVTVSA